MQGSDWLWVLGALGLGCVIGAAFVRSRMQERIAAADRMAAGERQRADQAAAEREKSDKALEASRDLVLAAEKSKATLEANLAAERTQAQDKLALLAQAEKKLADTFSALSADALRQSNVDFLTLAKTTFEQLQTGAKTDLDGRQKAIDEMLKPVRESLVKVDTTLQDLEKNRATAYGSLAQHLASMSQAQAGLQEETRRLVTALRAPHVRGAWGEMQLRRVVEMAGMLDHCDFQEQVASADGKLRPDLVVRLPGGKRIVVDAKAPLAAYLEHAEAVDETVRQQRLADHARQVRAHMTKLGQKNYWEQFDATPEFVVMFLPGEAFFGAALQHDPALIELGVDQRVLPASPVTLIALLRSVAYGWSQERIAESAEQISALGAELYERLRSLAEHFQKVGTGLEAATKAYNDAVGSIESRVLVSARKFRELGVPAVKDIPEITIAEKSVRELSAPEMRRA